MTDSNELPKKKRGGRVKGAKGKRNRGRGKGIYVPAHLVEEVKAIVELLKKESDKSLS